AESNILECLSLLKLSLSRMTHHEFWAALTTGLTNLMGAQYAFVSKRLLPHDPTRTVEMPPLGTLGSCYQAVAFHTTPSAAASLPDGKVEDVQYVAHSCPCASMRHDRALVIPHSLSGIYPHEANPNRSNFMAGPGEAYMTVPLWTDGKCVGHFGVMWTKSGLLQSRVKDLSWPLLEACLRSLEDLVQTRLTEHGSTPDAPNFPTPALFAGKLDSQDVAVSETQSLKPYARSLSHELRTPMQGVVGMLDVMYATMQEASEGLGSTEKESLVRQVFDRLKSDIEVVMDSSRRAVEAADNVVHAYDLNMGLPDTPQGVYHPGQSHPKDYLDAGFSMAEASETKPQTSTGVSDLSPSRGQKRRFDSLGHPTPSTPVPAKVAMTAVSRNSRGQGSTPEDQSPDDAPLSAPLSAPHRRSPDDGYELALHSKAGSSSGPGVSRETAIRPLLQFVVNDTLRVGGRPHSAVATPNGNGEIIEVRTIAPSGEERIKSVEWSVDDDVPEIVAGDEKDLSKLIGNVVLNAVKFTNAGTIWIRYGTPLSRPRILGRYLVIVVTDTGPGIPPAFLPQLFKAFAREDDGLTRQSEGLGLGLLVAKGIARRLGGDIFCIRADTDGPSRGSEFEIRIPLTNSAEYVYSSAVDSRPSSRYGSPAPSANGRGSSSDIDQPRKSGSPGIANAQSPSFPTTSSSLGQAPPTSNPFVDTRTKPNAAFEPAERSGKPTFDGANPASERLPSRPRLPDFGSYVMPNAPPHDRKLAAKHPLTFLVVEDNPINRRLLVSMLRKLGYPASSIYEAYDGAEAVRVWCAHRRRGESESHQGIDVILMDLWMPFMDGYEAAERILGNGPDRDMSANLQPTILAVTADVTDGAVDRALKSGMKGFMMKPYKLVDLERLIIGHCA
ncbi:hypothetical protein P152DRAFT_375784, partial [Eremomyces bilateralis CBS 781.70]